MTGGDVPVAQLKLRTLGYYKALVDGYFGPKTQAATKAWQKSIGLAADGIIGPISWGRLEAMAPTTPEKPVQAARPAPMSQTTKPVKPALVPTSRPEQTMNEPKYDPQRAVRFFLGRGYSKEAACALVASLMWESGGNGEWTIKWDAKGDKKNGVYTSRYSAQWNGPRIAAYETFARSIDRDFLDPYAQLAFLDYELRTTEKRHAPRLRQAETIEAANEAAIRIWRPSIPHADKRLVIARKLMEG